MAEIAGEHEDPHARIGVLEFPQKFSVASRLPSST